VRLTRLLAAADARGGKSLHRERAGRRDARYVELPLGDHSLSRQEDLLRFFLEMERFLTRYLDDQ
jgi:hypothetical protein